MEEVIIILLFVGLLFTVKRQSDNQAYLDKTYRDYYQIIYKENEEEINQIDQELEASKAELREISLKIKEQTEKLDDLTEEMLEKQLNIEDINKKIHDVKIQTIRLQSIVNEEYVKYNTSRRYAESKEIKYNSLIQNNEQIINQIKELQPELKERVNQNKLLETQYYENIQRLALSYAQQKIFVSRLNACERVNDSLGRECKTLKYVVEKMNEVCVLQFQEEQRKFYNYWGLTCSPFKLESENVNKELVSDISKYLQLKYVNDDDDGIGFSYESVKSTLQKLFRYEDKIIEDFEIRRLAYSRIIDDINISFNKLNDDYARQLSGLIEVLRANQKKRNELQQQQREQSFINTSQQQQSALQNQSSSTNVPISTLSEDTTSFTSLLQYSQDSTADTSAIENSVIYSQEMWNNFLKDLNIRPLDGIVDFNSSFQPSTIESLESSNNSPFNKGDVLSSKENSFDDRQLIQSAGSGVTVGSFGSLNTNNTSAPPSRSASPDKMNFDNSNLDTTIKNTTIALEQSNLGPSNVDDLSDFEDVLSTATGL